MKTKIYTKTGDTGETSLLGGTRVSKSDIRLDAYGTVDELNSILGLSLSYLRAAKIKADHLEDTLKAVQNELFVIGSQLACTDSELAQKLPQLQAQFTTLLENEIDKMNESLPELKNFILPGGSLAASTLHVARTVCRRAERNTIRIINLSKVVTKQDKAVVIALNRLSDYLFVAARYINFIEKQNETVWSPAGAL